MGWERHDVRARPAKFSRIVPSLAATETGCGTGAGGVPRRPFYTPGMPADRIPGSL